MKIVYSGEPDSRSFKDAFGEAIVRLCQKDPDVIYLDADLMSCVATRNFALQNPTRGFNCGIAEANMMGIAAGLAMAGHKPIVHSFGCFASRRAFDQVFLSAAYAQNAITVVGSDPGVTAAFNGGTHMPFEDVALYRTIPGATVIDCSDTAMLDSVLEQSLELPGVKYIRMQRKLQAKVYPNGSRLPIGRAVKLREGRDVAILAAGLMVEQAMMAADTLARQGVDAAVLDVFTIKPLDAEAVLDAAQSFGCLVVAENHNHIGGLYSAVCELLAARRPTPVEVVAVEDRFGAVGPQDYLQQEYGLTAENIAKKAIRAMGRKA